MTNPLFPFSDEKDMVTQEFQQAVFMDDTEEMLKKKRQERGEE